MTELQDCEKVIKKLVFGEKCPDCGVAPDNLHLDGCDVARCPGCGTQMLTCGLTCGGETSLERTIWTGTWPGVEECIEFGWYAKLNPDGPGWVPCNKDETGATTDLNRLYTDAVWSVALQRFVLPKQLTKD